MTAKTSLGQYMTQCQSSHKSVDEDLVKLVNEVGSACVKISNLVSQGALAGVLGAAGSENVQGEDQKKLDIISNEVFLETLQESGTLAGMASEEMETIYQIPAEFQQGSYLITFDPLDGSSNIDVNGSVGTIFSIMKCEDSDVGEHSFLQPGVKQVCAGYCLYSSASMLVLTLGHGVDGFTLDAASSANPEFVLTHPEIKIPERTNEYSINASYQRHWFSPVRRYIDEVLAGATGPRQKDFNMRWAGAMVGDVHRILCRGGIFMYPSDEKLASGGKAGKLRLLYEASPMGFIMEQAGGVASTGTERIVEIAPEELHQRVPVIMGSKEEVERLVSYHG